MPMFVFIWPWVLGAVAVATAAAIYDAVTEDDHSGSRSDDDDEREARERRRQRERDRANARAFLEQEAHEALTSLMRNHSEILSGQPRKLDLPDLKRFVQNPRLPDADLGVHPAPSWEEETRTLETLAAEIRKLEAFRDQNRPDQPNEK